MTDVRKVRVLQSESAYFEDTDSEMNSENVVTGKRVNYALPKDYYPPKRVHSQEVRTKNIF